MKDEAKRPVTKSLTTVSCFTLALSIVLAYSALGAIEVISNIRRF